MSQVCTCKIHQGFAGCKERAHCVHLTCLQNKMKSVAPIFRRQSLAKQYSITLDLSGNSSVLVQLLVICKSLQKKST